MSIGTSMLDEFDREMATTRRVLERVPTDKGTWKPHEKSFALGHLAQLVAGMPGWITMTIRNPSLDLEERRRLLLSTDRQSRGAIRQARRRSARRAGQGAR